MIDNGIKIRKKKKNLQNNREKDIKQTLYEHKVT